MNASGAEYIDSKSILRLPGQQLPPLLLTIRDNALRQSGIEVVPEFVLGGHLLKSAVVFAVPGKTGFPDWTS